MRWRTEQEVKDGRGQFSCGCRRCNQTKNLKTWEVDFTYFENEEKKNALVKVRLCPECSQKLNYFHKRKEIVKKKAKKKKNGKDLQLPYTNNLDTDKCEKQQSNQHDYKIWNTQADIEETNREDDFSNYLEDLFL